MAEHVDVRISVNGEDVATAIPARLLLVDLLRDRLGLTGTHVGCDTSNCGACTVLLDGAAVKSCTVLAVQTDGRQVTSIEGLAPGRELHPMQQAFWDNHGLQCGFCTPGMILAAVDLVEHEQDLTDDKIRHGIAGNLCRCTGYNSIVQSIAAAAAASTVVEKEQM